MKKINIDGIEYNIDVDKATKDGYLKPVVFRRIGQIYLDHTDGGTPLGYYVLARCDYNRVALISLKDGNRFRDPIKVGNDCDITEDEWKSLIGTQGHFKMETSAFMVTPYIFKY